ncbi:MAG: DUF1292 domain-containing protein [Clostridia bacterium]|nr:DUF1292 domain-containing protein [Clostridia bacterium]
MKEDLENLNNDEPFETDDAPLFPAPDGSDALDFDDDSLITLADEDGNELDFQLLDLFTDGGKEYIAIISIEKPEEGVLFLEADGDEDYLAVADEKEIERLFKIYEQRNNSGG